MDKSVTIRANSETFAALYELRKSAPDLPSRGELIRRLILMARAKVDADPRYAAKLGKPADRKRAQ